MKLKVVCLDFLMGFIALILLFVFVVAYRRNDLQLFALVTAVVFFLAGMTRDAGKARSPALTGFLVALGGAVPVVAMRVTGMAMTEQGYVPVFILFSLLPAIAGGETRQLASRGHHRASLLVALLCFSAALLIAALAIPPLMTTLSDVNMKRPSLPFSFATFDGASVTSTELRGHVVVLAFWATWCSPCLQEFPELENVYQQYKQNSAVAFYAVGGPWGDDSAAKESAFAKEMKWDIPLAFDAHRTAYALGVNAFPTLIILDKAGRIRTVHTGYDASEHLGRFLSRKVAALASE